MDLETTIDIDASADEVWTRLIDVARWPEWTDSILGVDLDGGRLTLGARARIRQPSTPTLTWEVTDLQPGRSFTWRASSTGLSSIASHSLEPIGDGRTRVTLALHQTGVLAGIVGRLTGARSRRYMEMEAAGLKRRTESQPA